MGCGTSKVQPNQAALALPYAAERAAAERAAAEKAAEEKAAAERAAAERATAEKAAAEKAAEEKAVAERPVLMAKAAAAYKLAEGRATSELTGAALSFGQQFELSTPMLVMPFGVFKAQGRIMKSTKAWRDEALAAGLLFEHEEGSGKVVIFISHTWWDRKFRDATNDPNNPYDEGAPDLQADYPDEQRNTIVDFDMDGNLQRKMVTYQWPKDLKWRVICAGVQRLLEQEGLKEEEVSLCGRASTRTTRRRSSRA